MKIALIGALLSVGVAQTPAATAILSPNFVLQAYQGSASPVRINNKDIITAFLTTTVQTQTNFLFSFTSATVPTNLVPFLPTNTVVAHLETTNTFIRVTNNTITTNAITNYFASWTNITTNATFTMSLTNGVTTNAILAQWSITNWMGTPAATTYALSNLSVGTNPVVAWVTTNTEAHGIDVTYTYFFTIPSAFIAASNFNGITDTNIAHLITNVTPVTTITLLTNGQYQISYISNQTTVVSNVITFKSAANAKTAKLIIKKPVGEAALGTTNEVWVIREGSGKNIIDHPLPPGLFTINEVATQPAGNNKFADLNAYGLHNDLATAPVEINLVGFATKNIAPSGTIAGTAKTVSAPQVSGTGLWKGVTNSVIKGSVNITASGKAE